MHLDLHYVDPLLVSTYDIENGGRDDIDFYLELARELGVVRAIDLGCGTGVLAVDLAARGAEVVGIDPAPAMLDVARSRPNGHLVTWVVGDAAAMASESADLVVMTGHAAQVLLSEDAWLGFLGNSARALLPQGYLAFETRNPSFEGWKSWNKEDSTATFQLPNGDSFSSWVQLTGTDDELVTFEGHTVFAGHGGHHVATSTLRFRSESAISQALSDAGFQVTEIFGGWDRSPVSSTSRELIFVARLS